MGLLRRGPRIPDARAQAAAIAEFWAWWQPMGATAVARVIESGRPRRVSAYVTHRVREIHPDLDWQLGPGTSSRHQLVVTAGGDPALRAAARRWLLAAPRADEVWSYADARPPVQKPATAVLTIERKRVAMSDATAIVVRRQTCIDLSVQHPAFASLPQEHQAQATYLLLDALLGEDAVQTWIRHVEWSADVDPTAVALLRLQAMVADLEQRWRPSPDGRRPWLSTEADLEGGQSLLVGAQVPLRPVTAPWLDTHVGLHVPYVAGPDGLPDTHALEEILAFERHIDDRLGDSGHVVAHELAQGSGQLHAYVEGSTPAVDVIRAAVTGWAHGNVGVDAASDPGWTRVSHLVT
ncbi:MAG TPA: DUF695 domain-containing protein [Actinomycetes bacterium]|nr:DUF695 domain-containing protein [Actinomycetes bacterium]